MHDLLLDAGIVVGWLVLFEYDAKVLAIINVDDFDSDELGVGPAS